MWTRIVQRSAEQRGALWGVTVQGGARCRGAAQRGAVQVRRAAPRGAASLAELRSPVPPSHSLSY